MPAPASDLATKLRLERKLSARMRSLFGSIGRTLQNSLGTGVGSVSPSIARVWQPVLVQILVDHYATVAKTFARPIVAAMPSAVAPGEEERKALALALARVFGNRAEEQAKLVLETAERRVARSVGRASMAIAAPGSGLTSADLPRLAARDWVRRQVVQARAVATYETQTAAETAKGVVVARLSGHPSPVHKDVVGEPWKVWQTQGDSRVRGADGKGRFDHFDADGQRVPVSGSFEVSGERLRWPGDRSLGASDGNVYGCRCTALYETDTVAELRALIGERLVADARRFLQTASDVVVSLPFTL